MDFGGKSTLDPFRLALGVVGRLGCNGSGKGAET